MGIDGSSLCETLLSRESALRSSTLAKRDAFTYTNARRHFNEGFVIRHYMLQSSRLFLSEHCKQSRKEPLSPYEATDCAIHLNAYYLNLRGVLDNLAWVLQYEWRLLADVAEDKKNRKQCNLFGNQFLAVLQLQYPKLASLLNPHKDWANELAKLRDPAAHRIPLYIPPIVFTSQEQVDKFRRIVAQAEADPSEWGDRSISEIYHEAQAVTDFMPVMTVSTPQGLGVRSISEQIQFDHDKYLTIAKAVVDAL